MDKLGNQSIGKLVQNNDNVTSGFITGRLAAQRKINCGLCD